MRLNASTCDGGYVGRAATLRASASRCSWLRGSRNDYMRGVHALVLMFTLAVTNVTLAQVTSTGSQSPYYRVIYIGDFGGGKLPLLRLEAIQAILKLSDLQKERQATILKRLDEKWQAIRNSSERATSRATIVAAAEEELLENLEPTQRARLDQIRLQLQGSTAFTLPDIPQRLELSTQQVTTIRAIAEKSRKEIEKASHIPLSLKPMDSSVTVEAIRSLVESEQFTVAKARALQAVFDRRSASLRQIEEALNSNQLSAYRKLLGEPFDIEAFFRTIAPKDVDSDVRGVADALGLTGQRADPNFDVKVARPAYVSEHPSVLFDEAHHNFHTTGGRYKAFADLITNDGYRVTPNREKFTAPLLAKYNVLVIANALGAERMGQPDAANPAFSESECNAVDDWVDGGGSLLLITDHPPFGSAADLLAKRFGVEMSKGVTVDSANGTERGLLFARANQLLGDHPITNGRNESEQVNRVLTFTGQSLKGPTGSIALLKFADTAVDRRDGKNVPAAGRAQGVAFNHGKGRVIVFGEAAQLSAQLVGFPPSPMGMNAPGCDNRQMALNSMHWLSGLTQ